MSKSKVSPEDRVIAYFSVANLAEAQRALASAKAVLSARLPKKASVKKVKEHET